MFAMDLAIFPYIVTNGNGREAIKFYEDAIDAKVLSLQTFGEMPENPEIPIPSEAKDRILNAQLKIGNTNLMLSDTFPGSAYKLGNQVEIAITMNDIEKSKEIYNKLQESGQVLIPLQETFWSPSYGSVTDKFGVSWQISVMDVQ